MVYIEAIVANNKDIGGGGEGDGRSVGFVADIFPETWRQSWCPPLSHICVCALRSGSFHQKSNEGI